MDYAHIPNLHGSNGVSPSLASLKHGDYHWEGEAPAVSGVAANEDGLSARTLQNVRKKGNEP